MELTPYLLSVSLIAGELDYSPLILFNLRLVLYCFFFIRHWEPSSLIYLVFPQGKKEHEVVQAMVRSQSWESGVICLIPFKCMQINIIEFGETCHLLMTDILIEMVSHSFKLVACSIPKSNIWMLDVHQISYSRA